MKLFIGFILLVSIHVSAQDALLEVMMMNLKEPREENHIEEWKEEEPELHSWELGTPDNIPETVVIYSDESSPCELTYR